MITKVTLKAKAMHLYKCPHSHMHKLWWLLYAISILLDEQLVAFSILTI